MKNSSRRSQRTTNSNSRSQRTTNSNSRSQRTTNSSTNENSYTTVAPNIYRDGSSYRARVSVNGIRYSRNCRTKREAIQWRNEMIGDRA